MARPRRQALYYLLALRPHHWTKNALVFVPAVAAHETDPAAYALLGVVFLAFSAVASSTYAFNDIVDLPHDRQHPSKSRRPLAAGTVRPSRVAAIGTLLATGGLAVAFAVSWIVGCAALLHLCIGLTYSLLLKRHPFIDVVALAVLYGLRVAAGALAAAVPLSAWLLAFCSFLFLALAVVKRQGELRRLSRNDQTVRGRGYDRDDLATMTALGSAAGFASVVILALYIQSPQVTALYSLPEALWLICLLLVYWFGRMTVLANRGVVDDDPIVFALRDRASWLTGLAALIAFLVAL